MSDDGRSVLRFEATIRKIGINPYVRVPVAIVRALLAATGKSAGPIPVKGALQGKRFAATVVLFRGIWRLYLNGPMRSASGVDVGDTCTIALGPDTVPRLEPMLPELARAFKADPDMRAAFNHLPPYRRREILRYLNSIKRPETREKNIAKVIDFLSGREVAGLVVVTR